MVSFDHRLYSSCFYFPEKNDFLYIFYEIQEAVKFDGD